VNTHLLTSVITLYASSLGASIVIIGFIVGLYVGLYSIINTPANIIFGQLIDRVGYKAPLIMWLIDNVLSMIFHAKGF